MEQIRKSRIWDLMIMSIAIISLTLFISISFFSWKHLDDFVFLTEIRENSILSFAWKWYYNWDARFLMPYCLVWFTAMKYFGIKILIPLASLSFILCSYYIVRIISRLNNYNLNWIHTLSLTALVNLVLWICLYHIDSQILYWMTGSVYLHAMLLALIWLNIYLIQPYKAKYKRLLYYLLSFIVATSVQNVSIGLLVLIAINRIVYKSSNEGEAKTHWNNTHLLIIFVSGIFISTVSPGSLVQFTKMHAINYDANSTNNTILDYIVHFFGLYINALKPNGILLFLTALLVALSAVIFSGVKIMGFSYKVDYLYKGFQFKEVLKRFKWLLVSVGSLAIYWPTLLYGDRYYIGFYMYLFIALVLFYINTLETVKVILTPRYLYMLIILVLLFGNYKYYGVLKERRIVAKHMMERENNLSRNKGASSVTLEAIDFESFTRPSRCVEISEDVNFYANKNYSSYFNIDTIKVSRKITKVELYNK